MMQDWFGTRTRFETGSGPGIFYRLAKLEEDGLAQMSRLPYSIRILLEAVLRNCDGQIVQQEHVTRLAGWAPHASWRPDFPFMPGRVIMQDLTGVPAVVDLVAMRSAMARLGGDPQKINPLVPVNLIIDHSLQVDVYGCPEAMSRNAEIEFRRNRERYEFLRWGQQAFSNFGVVPPASGIVHQVNLEYLATGVQTSQQDGETVVYPDSLVGTDSHTSMISGLGVLGWGVGGIEAEAAMLGQPIYMPAPDVVGFRLSGRLRDGVTATDLVLTVTQMLRQKGVVGKIVEYCGPGLDRLSLPDRATIANMAPDYGATTGFFPLDQESLNYLRFTGRPEQLVTLVERYAREQGLFRTKDSPIPEFSDMLELDLGDAEPCVAGPKRPQDRIPLGKMKESFQASLTAPVEERGYSLKAGDTPAPPAADQPEQLGHGTVVIAAITSCTNTSNPNLLLAAGLLAKKAVERGLRSKPYVKTSLAPGSQVVTDYLSQAGLTPYLEQLGFYNVGYGCTTCLGNSGPLPEWVANAINTKQLVAAAVLSGNRNFEGRVHPLVKANYLASPPLVVAFALVGSVDVNLASEPLGLDPNGQPVYLRDIWPSQAEIMAESERALSPQDFQKAYAGIENKNPEWNAVPIDDSPVYEWNPESTYIQEPPFFMGMAPEPSAIQAIEQARVLVKVGDSVTTDHISPAGPIAEGSPAAQYLLSLGIQPADFNTYGARRGNDRIMARGAFANIRLKNQMAPGTEGSWTTYLLDGSVTSIFDAAQRYQQQNTPLLVLAGKEYGTGSSRDWAAKGPALLGVKAVLAESFERIHRSNLVGMGILPLQFKAGQDAASLGLDGTEIYTIHIDDDLQPLQDIQVDVVNPDGSNPRSLSFNCRMDTPVEVNYYRNGGILQTVLRSLLDE